MNQTASKSRRRRGKVDESQALTAIELAKLGDGDIAYIKVMTSDEAQKAFPTIEGLPTGINLYALHSADGTPLALTDSRSAAVGHARGDELEVRALH
jgi:hypothetical protein